MSAMQYSHHSHHGPSIFKPKVVKDREAYCRLNELTCGVARGGGLRAMWFVKTDGSLQSIRIMESQLGLEKTPAPDGAPVDPTVACVQAARKILGGQ